MGINIVKSITIVGMASLLIVSAACNKKKDTIAKITVKDDQNALVADCRVVLKGEATDPAKSANVTWYDTTYTNSMGEAIFNYTERYQKGMAGVAILKIEAKKDAMSGTGMIKIEEEKTNTESVFIHP